MHAWETSHHKFGGKKWSPSHNAQNKCLLPQHTLAVTKAKQGGPLPGPHCDVSPCSGFALHSFSASSALSAALRAIAGNCFFWPALVDPEDPVAKGTYLSQPYTSPSFIKKKKSAVIRENIYIYTYKWSQNLMKWLLHEVSVLGALNRLHYISSELEPLAKTGPRLKEWTEAGGQL